MNTNFHKILEVLELKTTKEFLDKENKKLVRLFMKINASDIPTKYATDIIEVINMILMVKAVNTDAEYQHLDKIHTDLLSRTRLPITVPNRDGNRHIENE
ncbi:hypothetical protein LJB86_03585 [Deltaproteobacteria bacterium OttesenSCG-928-M10]|nr:hypothetical protein [Deltaproteobacteria bacterium OttesenSCG-928-M10]